MTAASAPARARQGRILVASPCAEARGRILRNLPLGALESAEAIGGADALMKLEESQFHTLVLDPKLDDLSAEELVSIIRSRHPELKIVMLDRQSEEHPISLDYSDETRSEESTDENAMSFQPQGARLGICSRVGSVACCREKPSRRFDPLPGMIGSGLRMQHLYRLARLVAPRDTAVLIVGATGTGKELVAHGIHGLSRGSRGPFVVVNCAAIPESLLEAELFGFTRGAFTGAFQSRLGRIHAAHGGTLLLDEVGELPLSMQAKLLRFVQEGEVQRLGSADMFRVDARIIAATNANLFQRVREKQFREDLYYRLAVFPLELPLLCNRSEDVLPLAHYFLEALCRESGASQKNFSAEAVSILRKHLWPGNVRELHHWIERAFVLSEADNQIRSEDLCMPSETI